jgi:hypothetical protein
LRQKPENTTWPATRSRPSFDDLPSVFAATSARSFARAWLTSCA